MLRTILAYLIIGAGIVNILHVGLFIVGANIYDIKTFFKMAVTKKHVGGKSPLVSLVIPAHNEQLVIERCLDSIRCNTYRKVEVFVHDDKSTDNTARLVRAYKKRYPHMQIRLISRRVNVGKGAGVNYCIATYARGELVMTLDADCILQKRAIKNAVDYFVDPHIIGVAANVKLMETPSLLGLLQQFEHMIAYRSKKFYTLANCEFIVGGVASTYRTEVLKAVGLYDTDTQTEDIGLSTKVVAKYGKSKKIVYGANVLAMTEPVYDFRGLLKQRYRWKLGMIQNLVKYRRLMFNPSGKYHKSLTLYRLPIALLGELMLLTQPFIMTYIIYASIMHHTTVLFFGAYVIVTAFVLLNIWPDEYTKPLKKLEQSFYAPIMYFVFYIMDVIQVASIFWVLARPHKVLRKGYAESSWVSPKRAGQLASFN